MLPVAVLAGGLGMRLRDVTGPDVPKVLVPVLGRPFLDYKLSGLAADGIEDVVLLVGHQGDVIRTHVGDGTAFGLHVTCVDDGAELLGTGGALLRALPALGEEFWVTYGDTLLEFDLAAAEEAFHHAGTKALMTVLPASAPQAHPEPNNARVEGALVVEYAKDPAPIGAAHIDYGMLALREDALLDRSAAHGFDLVEVLGPLAHARQLAAFEVTERFHDVGTPDALAETEEWLSGRAPFGDPGRADR